MHMPVSFLQAPRPWHGAPPPPEPHLWYSQALPKLRLSITLALADKLTIDLH